MQPRLIEVFQRLLDHFGAQRWWPGDSPLEIMVGAVLVQNTQWANAERAIAQLREAAALSLGVLARLDSEELAETIRPAGAPRVKARRLKNLVGFVVERHGGDLDAMFATDQETLRGELLAINGIGPETADAILLYAGGLPAFVVDAYARRVLGRHAWIEPEADYAAVQEFFTSGLPRDAPLYNEFHALLVRVGKEHCGRIPKCEGCPLAEWLPECGPRERE